MMELRDSHMSDMAEVSAGVFDLNMNPEMALMVEKDINQRHKARIT